MKAPSNNNGPKPRYSVSGVSYAIASLGYPDGPDSSPDSGEISDLVDDCEFAAWLRELIELSSDSESPNYRPDSVEASEASEIDAEIEWRATKTLETLSAKQQQSLLSQVEAEFPGEICYEVSQIMPVGGDDEEDEENPTDEPEEETKPTAPVKPPYQMP